MGIETLAGIGSWVVGVFSTSAGAAIAGTGFAAMIGGAIVGAAIGGITAAVTGGSIGKGMLFGAIGGAVLGGIGAWANDMSWTLNAGTSSSGSAAGMSGGQIWNAIDATEVGGTVKLGTAATKGSSWMTGMGAAAVTTVGSAVQGAYSEDAADPNDPEEREKDRDLEREKIAAQKEIAAMQAASSGSSGGSSGEAAAEASKYATNAELQNAREQRDQDWKVNEREYTAIAEAKRERQESVLGLNVTGDNVKPMDKSAKSIDEQAYAQTKIPTQTTAAPQYSGVLNQPTEEQQVA